MADLVEFLLTADLADLETTLGDMYAPTCAAIVFVGCILPPCIIGEAVCALIRALGGGSRG